MKHPSSTCIDLTVDVRLMTYYQWWCKSHLHHITILAVERTPLQETVINLAKLYSTKISTRAEGGENSPTWQSRRLGQKHMYQSTRDLSSYLHWEATTLACSPRLLHKILCASVTKCAYPIPL